MRVAVGSTNPVKVEAVAAVIRRVWPEAVVESVEVPSGVGEQPVGDADGRRGALNRARRAREARRADVGVGLEGAITETEMGPTTVGWCVIVDAAGRMGVSSSGHVRIPRPAARRALEGRELGLAMDELTGIRDVKRRMGAIGVLTDGLLDRRSAYEHAVKLALAPFLRPDLYAEEG